MQAMDSMQELLQVREDLISELTTSVNGLRKMCKQYSRTCEADRKSIVRLLRAIGLPAMAGTTVKSGGMAEIYDSVLESLDFCVYVVDTRLDRLTYKSARDILTIPIPRPLDYVMHDLIVAYTKNWQVIISAYF